MILSLFAYPQPQMLMVAEMQKKFSESGEIIDADYKIQFEDFVKKFIAFSAKISSE